MKKILACLAMVALALAPVLPAAACIDKNGNPVTGTNGESTDCASAEETLTTGVDTRFLQYGQITEKGRSYTKQITITNGGESVLVIDASIEEYADVPESNRAMAGWLAFVGGVTHFSVAQGATRVVSVRMVVPEDAAAGSQYAVIRLKGNGFNEAVVARADIAGDDYRYDSKVEGAWINIVHLDEKVTGSVTVKNSGTAGFASKYQLRAKALFGGVDWEVLHEEEAEVIPGGEYKFETDANAGFGIYNVEQRVTFVNAEGRIVESLLTRTVINLPWWVLAIAGGVIVLIIILIVVLRRKHKKKKLAKQQKIAEKALEKRKAAVETAEQQSIEAVAEPEVAEEPEVVEEEKPAAPAPKKAKKVAIRDDSEPAPAKKPAKKKINVQ